MTDEILTVAEAYAADKFAESAGVRSLALMENAGRSVADEIARRMEACRAVVLCGPGNNGGDGYVVARNLQERGFDVLTASLAPREALTGDAAEMADRWTGETTLLTMRAIEGADIVVDALFGAGLSRPLEGMAKDVALTLNGSEMPVVAVDVPSGLHGDLGRSPAEDGVCLGADLTVTFFRKKPAHVLMPGRLSCGEVVVADIGIPDAAAARATLFENTPSLWGRHFPWPQPESHKYARGHCIAVSGPAHATGAARLAARGALRVGAGLVSVASPLEAVSVNAAQLTAVMVKPFAGASGLTGLLKDRRFNAVAIGPGCGVGKATQELVGAVLASGTAVVLDADALTSFELTPATLFAQLREPCVLTPHAGEFERIFPGLLGKSPNRIEAARVAAKTAKCTVLLKGPDTVIAGADGRAAVNTNAPPWLATAGAGDVLSGMTAGLLAQGMQSFEAACAAAWLHGEAANVHGLGLIAEDLPEALPAALRNLKERLEDERSAHSSGS